LSPTYCFLVLLSLFEFLFELLDLVLSFFLRPCDVGTPVFDPFDFKLMLYFLLHEAFFLGEVLRKQRFSVSERVPQLCDLNGGDVAEHFLVFDRHCVAIVVKSDAYGLREVSRVATQRVELFCRLFRLRLVLVDVVGDVLGERN